MSQGVYGGQIECSADSLKHADSQYALQTSMQKADAIIS